MTKDISQRIAVLVVLAVAVATLVPVLVAEQSCQQLIAKYDGSNWWWGMSSSSARTPARSCSRIVPCAPPISGARVMRRPQHEAVECRHVASAASRYAPTTVKKIWPS
jgi:hypothetical protein